MINQVQKRDLGYLGLEFQYRFIKSLMEDNDLFRDLQPIIDQNMFTEPMLKIYVGSMKDYYEKNDAFPSYEMMGIVLNNLSKSEADRMMFEELNKKIRNTSMEGNSYIKETAIKFFRQQNIIKCANKILSIAGEGNIDKYDECIEILQEANARGASYNLGEHLFDELTETLSADYREPIPTGIDKLDEALNGGLGKGELGVIIGSSGFGKAQSLSSRIVTPNGFKLMGDIKVGDEVIGKDGLAHKVTGVYPQGIRPIYKVTLSNGTSCECDIEHLWNVNSYYQRCAKKYIKGVSKGRDDKYYSPDYSFKTLSLKTIIEKGLIKGNGRRKKYNFKVPMPLPVHFNEQEIKLDPYFVGYFLGDGCFSKIDITVGSQDKDEIHDILSPILGDDFRESYHRKRNIWNFLILNKTKKLIEEELTYSLASNKKIPEKYLFNSIENRIALLQGLLDSDGCANKNGSVEFCSKSKTLSEQVQFLVRSLGGFATLMEHKSGYFNKAKNQYIDCGMRYRVTISLCDSSIPLFRLKRKQERVKYRTRLSDDLYIVSAEYVRDDEAQCIMVDSDEHLYLTEDFIVTHNTTITTSMSSYASTYKCAANLEQGYKVLQIVFEDGVKAIKRKHIARLTNIEACNLSKPEYIEEVKRIIGECEDYEMLQKNLRILALPTGEINANQIKEKIKQLHNTGFYPDMVVLDYFECLDMGDVRNGENEFNKEGRVMRKLEHMAKDYNFALWVTTQGTRDSVNAEIVTMDKAGGSFKKVQIAHVVLSIARTTEDIKNNKATLALLKNRAGGSGSVWTNVSFNNGTCRISTDNVEDYDDLFEYKKKRDKDEVDLQMAIFKKYKKQEKNDEG